ncbi:MAG: hypothetical protein ABIW82_03955 [Dokdonella sp.]
MAIPSELRKLAFAEVLNRYGLAKDADWNLTQAYEEVAAELLQLIEIDRASTTWPAGTVMPPG